MKSCVFFVVMFLSGIGMFVSGFVYDVMYGGLSIQDAAERPDPAAQSHRNRARYLEVGGIALVFGTVFAAAGWGFYTRERGDGDGEGDGPEHAERPRLASIKPDRDGPHEDQ